MQWPPIPGPGQKGMNPKGLVAAASITSQMSMPIRSARMASSLTSAMLTERNMFSSIFDELGRLRRRDGEHVVADRRVEATRASVQSAVMPPTTFGVVRIV